MTCYQRHMGWLFESLGLEYDKPTRAKVHAAIADALGLPADAHCPEVWAALKERYGIDTKSPESVELEVAVGARLAGK